MTRADGRLQRLLAAFPIMADEPQLSIEALAARIGTTAKTLRSDLVALERYDLPGGFVEAVTVEVQAHRVELLHADLFTRPQRLSRPELLALELGLSMLAQEAPMEEQATIESARAQVRALAVPVVRTATEHRGTRAGAPDGAAALAVEAAPDAQLAALAVLHRALEDRLVVGLTYHRPSEPEATPRRVRPYAMIRADGAVYLVAWCERAAALRLFRLDRVVRAELTPDAFVMPSDFSLEQVLQDGRVFTREEAPPATMLVRYSATVARWIAEREGRTTAPDGTLEVEYPLADEAWAIRHVLQYGPDAVVVRPAALRETLRQRLTAMRR